MIFNTQMSALVFSRKLNSSYYLVNLDHRYIPEYHLLHNPSYLHQCPFHHLIPIIDAAHQGDHVLVHPVHVATGSSGLVRQALKEEISIRKNLIERITNLVNLPSHSVHNLVHSEQDCLWFENLTVVPMFCWLLILLQASS